MNYKHEVGSSVIYKHRLHKVFKRSRTYKDNIYILLSVTTGSFVEVKESNIDD